MKSTFQKPDSTHPHGSLREQPEMKRPDGGTYRMIDDYKEDEREYQKHIATVRTIPCSENNWKDGQELEEGKDYELRVTFNLEPLAVPIVPITIGDNKTGGIGGAAVQETEDELWKEVIQIVELSEHLNMEPTIEILKSNFTGIQRRKQ